MIQEEIELSTVTANRSSLCEEAEENPYSEIRCSQCIEEISSNERWTNTVLCPMRELDYTSDKHNFYRTHMDKNVYDHVNLKVNYAKAVSDKNPDLRNDEYVSLWRKGSLGKDVLQKNDLKSQSLKLPQNTTSGHKAGKSDKLKHTLLNNSLQLTDIKLDAKLDHLTEEVNQTSVDTDNLIGGQRNNRPYSLAHCLSNSDVSVDERESFKSTDRPC